MSNLARTCRDVEDVVKEHRVAGAEAIIESIVYANASPYLNEEEMVRLVHDAFERYGDKKNDEH